MIYRIENNNVVFRHSEEILDGWKECEFKDGVAILNDPIAEELQRLKLEAFEATKYMRDRAEAYPSLIEQADMAYWDRQNNTTTLDDAISKVKLKFPKPESK